MWSTEMFWKGLLVTMAIIYSAFAMKERPQEEIVFDDWTLTAEHKVSCPQDFTLVATQCLQFNTVDQLKWQEAIGACKAKNASLLIPDNYKEFSNYVGSKYHNFGFWIGASYNASEGKWLSLDGEPLQTDIVITNKLYPRKDYCLMTYHGKLGIMWCPAANNYICMSTPSAQVQPKNPILPLSTTPAATTIPLLPTTPPTTTDTTTETASTLRSTSTTESMAPPKTTDTACSFTTGLKYWPHPTNCHMFIKCTPNGPEYKHCPRGTAWSRKLFFCIHEDNTNCKPESAMTKPDEEDATCQCGVPNRQRIFGGEEVSHARKYPWQVGLYDRHSPIKCGGSIINDRWILTAAHCIINEQTCELTYNSTSSIKVIVGEHSQYRNVSHITKDYSIKQFVPHPDYSCTSLLNDFALLELTESIHFNDVIRPICLPEDNSEKYVGSTGIVTGWGQTSYNITGMISFYLKEVKVVIRAEDGCKGMHTLIGPKLQDPYMCASGVKNGTGACKGDSGGPLFVFEENRGIYIQVGVVSFTMGKNASDNAECDNPEYPTIYARVSEALEWIAQTTSNGMKCY